MELHLEIVTYEIRAKGAFDLVPEANGCIERPIHAANKLGIGRKREKWAKNVPSGGFVVGPLRSHPPETAVATINPSGREKPPKQVLSPLILRVSFTWITRHSLLCPWFWSSPEFSLNKTGGRDSPGPERDFGLVEEEGRKGGRRTGKRTEI